MVTLTTFSIDFFRGKSAGNPRKSSGNLLKIKQNLLRFLGLVVIITTPPWLHLNACCLNFLIDSVFLSLTLPKLSTARSSWTTRTWKLCCTRWRTTTGTKCTWTTCPSGESSARLRRRRRSTTSGLTRSSRSVTTATRFSSVIHFLIHLFDVNQLSIWTGKC